MTTTACLPGCREGEGVFWNMTIHATGCPNGPRAPQADVSPGSEWQREAEENGRRFAAKPAPQAEALKVMTSGYITLAKPSPAPEPKQGSEEPIDWDAAKASSESWAKGRPLPHDLKCTPAQETLGRAYVALRAEVENWRNESLPAKLIDALRTENERLYGKVQGHGLVLAERDALRAELAQAEKACALALDYVQGSPRPRHMDVMSALREVLATTKEGESR